MRKYKNLKVFLSVVIITLRWYKFKFIKIPCNVGMNGTFLRTEVYISFTWRLTFCYKKIKELRFTAKSTDAAIIGTCESKLDASILEQGINIDNHKILRCDRNRHGGGVPCCVRNDLSYNILSLFPSEIENIFLEILLPNTKPVIAGIVGTSILPSKSK